MATVKDLNRLSYNGINFEIYKSEISSSPVYDDGEVTVIGVKHLLSVTAWVYSDEPQIPTTNLIMKDMKERLMKNGGKLTIQDKGWDEPLVINEGNLWDSNFGPKPRKLNWKPIGDKQAALVEYQIEFQIPECDKARYRGVPMAITYSRSTSWDESGYLQIVCSGSIEIPLTKRTVSSNRISDHIDNYREYIYPPVLDGFQRTKHHTQETPDHRKMTFEFVDTELPAPMQQYCSKMDINFELRSEWAKGFIEWQGSIGGRITIVNRESKTRCFRAFMNIVNDKLNSFDAPTPPVVVLGIPISSTTPRGTVFINDVRFRDNMYGKDAELHVGFTIIMRQNAHTILAATRMWHPVGNQQQWRLSMNSIWHPRGPNPYRHDVSSDVIVDLCLGPPNLGFPSRVGATMQPKPTPNATAPDVIRSHQALGVAGVTAHDPGNDASNTWLAYNLSVSYHEPEGRFAVHKPMGGTTQELNTQNPSAHNLQQLTAATSYNIGSVTTNTPNNIHEVQTPSPVVRLKGSAVRFNHEIPLPKIVSVGGIPAVQNRVVGYATQQMGTLGGEPIIGAVWDIEYLLTEPPQNALPVPKNPLLPT